VRSTILALVTALIALPLAAQTDGPRRGFFLSVGMGGGSAGVTCPQCGDIPDERMNGVSGYLRFGGTVSSRLQVGVEGSGWIKNSGGLERRIAGASLVFIGYPSATGGFWVKSGVGGLRAVVENDIATVVGEGLMFQAGIGFDIPLGTGAALTPFANYIYSTGVAAAVNSVSTGFDLNPNVFQVGLGITIP
jgi:hypothetical protein